MIVHINYKSVKPKPKPKMKLKDVFMEKGKAKANDMEKKLKEHSKLHKGGMKGKHMKNMVKFIKEGDTFSIAHNKAKKLDSKISKKVKKKKY